MSGGINMLDEKYMKNLSGGERLEYLKKTIEEADGGNDTAERLRLRKLYIDEALACDDILSAGEMLPELSELFDSSGETLSAKGFLYTFKNVTEKSAGHYDISAEQTDDLLEQLKGYLKKYGYSQRSYYLAKYSALRNVNIDAALMAFAEAEKLEPEDEPGCMVCDTAMEINKEMQYGSERRAVELLSELTEQGLRCADVPQTVYGTFIHEFTLRGMYAEAEHYAGLLMPLVKGSEERFLKELSYAMGLNAVTDQNAAYNIFCKCAGIFSSHKNPEARFWFADAAQRFFAKLEALGSEDFHAKLPESFELYRADGAYKISKLKNFFSNAAKELAEKFDGRNGTRVYSDALKAEYPESPIKELELPLHGSVVPDSPAYGVLFRSMENIPSPKAIAEIAAERFGFEEIRLSGEREAPVINLVTKTKDGDPLRYRFILADAPDASEFSAGQRLPDDAVQKVKGYGKMLAVMPGIASADRLEELRMLIKLADALNSDGASVIYDLGCDRMLSAKWAELSAESLTPPPAVRCVRLHIYPSATVPGAEDIFTTGMTIFGSRELTVTGVEKEDMNFTVSVLEKLITEIAMNPLPDEGFTMNSGISRGDNEFVRLTWRAVRFPDDEASDIYAEPILYLGSSDDRGVKINEISEADRSSTAPIKHKKTAENDEMRNKMLFPRALEYFRNNKCSLTVGVNILGVDADDKPQNEFFHAELLPDGKSGRVISHSPGLSDVKDGDTAPIDPKDVFFFRIDNEKGSFFADEMYVLLQ